MNDSEPFVSAILKDLPEDSTVEDVLAGSPGLQELAQQHNKLVYETKGIDSLSKDLTGKQFKREINKHVPEVIVLLLSTYLGGTRILVENSDDDLLEVIPKDTSVVRVSKRRSTDVADKTDTGDKAPIENKNDLMSNINLAASDMRELGLFALRMLLITLLIFICIVFGTVVYLSVNSGKPISDELIGTLLSSALELIKFAVVPPIKQ